MMAFNEMIGGGEGFSLDYAAIAPTPLPQYCHFRPNKDQRRYLGLHLDLGGRISRKS